MWSRGATGLEVAVRQVQPIRWRGQAARQIRPQEALHPDTAIVILQLSQLRVDGLRARETNQGVEQHLGHAGTVVVAGRRAEVVARAFRMRVDVGQYPPDLTVGWQRQDGLQRRTDRPVEQHAAVDDEAIRREVRHGRHVGVQRVRHLASGRDVAGLECDGERGGRSGRERELGDQPLRIAEVVDVALTAKAEAASMIHLGDVAAEVVDEPTRLPLEQRAGHVQQHRCLSCVCRLRGTGRLVDLLERAAEFGQEVVVTEQERRGLGAQRSAQQVVETTVPDP